MLTSHSVIINKTARYYTLGTLTDKLETVWFVLHGYGQLAKDFIKEFTVLENATTYIVVPEALNKFYLRGFSGKIGATWLTKEDRENEINNYTDYLEYVFLKEIGKDYQKKLKVNILGFSQGAHTCVRWLNRYKHKIDNLILWGGSFPRDCNLNDGYWSKIKTQLVVGNHDKFISKEMLQKEELYLRSQSINYKIFNFDGGHELDDKTLLMLS